VAIDSARRTALYALRPAPRGDGGVAETASTVAKMVGRCWPAPVWPASARAAHGAVAALYVLGLLVFLAARPHRRARPGGHRLGGREPAPAREAARTDGMVLTITIR
jgi:hypothetical protein